MRIYSLAAVFILCIGMGGAAASEECSLLTVLDGAVLDSRTSLSSLLRIEEGGNSLNFAALANRDGLLVRAGAEYHSAAASGRSADFMAGPSRLRGALRMLASPTGYSAVLSCQDSPLDADSSLASAVSGLGLTLSLPASDSLAAPGLSFFAIASGLEPGCILNLPGIGRDWTQNSLPFSLAGGGALLSDHFALIIALSARRSAAEESGWRLDSAARPAGSSLMAACVSEWGGPGSSGRASAAVQCEAHGKPSFAFRLEGESRAGTLSAAARAGIAGPGFRLPIESAQKAPCPSCAAGLALDLDFALKHAALARFSLRLELPSAELWSGKTERIPTRQAFRSGVKLGLSLPLAAASGGRRRLRLRPEFELRGLAAGHGSADSQSGMADSDSVDSSGFDGTEGDTGPVMESLRLSCALDGREGAERAPCLSYSLKPLVELLPAAGSRTQGSAGRMADISMSLESEARFGPAEGAAPAVEFSLKLVFPDLLDPESGPGSEVWTAKARGRLNLEWQLEEDSSLMIGLELRESPLGLSEGSAAADSAAAGDEPCSADSDGTADRASRWKIRLAYRRKFSL